MIATIISAVPWTTLVELAPAVVILMILVIYLLWSRDKEVASLANEVHSNTLQLERLTTLLEVLVYGKFPKNSGPRDSERAD